MRKGNWRRFNHNLLCILFLVSYVIFSICLLISSLPENTSLGSISSENTSFLTAIIGLIAFLGFVVGYIILVFQSIQNVWFSDDNSQSTSFFHLTMKLICFTVLLFICILNIPEPGVANDIFIMAIMLFFIISISYFLLIILKIIKITFVPSQTYRRYDDPIFLTNNVPINIGSSVTDKKEKRVNKQQYFSYIIDYINNIMPLLEAIKDKITSCSDSFISESDEQLAKIESAFWEQISIHIHLIEDSIDNYLNSKNNLDYSHHPITQQLLKRQNELSTLTNTLIDLNNRFTRYKLDEAKNTKIVQSSEYVTLSHNDNDDENEIVIKNFDHKNNSDELNILNFESIVHENEGEIDKNEQADQDLKNNFTTIWNRGKCKVIFTYEAIDGSNQKIVLKLQKVDIDLNNQVYFTGISLDNQQTNCFSTKKMLSDIGYGKQSYSIRNFLTQCLKLDCEYVIKLNV